MARLWHGNPGGRARRPRAMPTRRVARPCAPPRRARPGGGARRRRPARPASSRPGRRLPRRPRRPPRPRPRPADRAPSPVSADTIEHPTGAGDIVLRAATRGGFVRLETVMSRRAGVHALRRRPGARSSRRATSRRAAAEASTRARRGTVPSTVPTLREVRLSEAEVQALLKFALVDGRLGTARDAYMGGNMDAPSTVFELNADGADRSILVTGLTDDPAPGPGCRGAAGVLRPGRPAAVDRHRRGLHVRPDDGGDHRDLGRARRDRPAVAVDRPRARRLPPAAGRRREPVPLAPADGGTGHRGRTP